MVEAQRKNSYNVLFYFRANWLNSNQSCSYTSRKSAEEKLGIEKPKRPLTPFFKFMTQMRPALLAKNPGITSKEAIAWSSKHWQELDSEVIFNFTICLLYSKIEQYKCSGDMYYDYKAYFFYNIYVCLKSNSIQKFFCYCSKYRTTNKSLLTSKYILTDDGFLRAWFLCKQFYSNPIPLNVYKK